MVDRIRRFQVLNSQILSTLNKYLSSGSSASGGEQVEQVKCFQPPIHPALTNQGAQPIYMRTNIFMRDNGPSSDLPS